MTRREEIIRLLHKRKWAAKQLADYFETSEKAINEDMEHVAKSVKKKLKGEPAFCRECSYRFNDREKKKKPSRCKLSIAQLHT